MLSPQHIQERLSLAYVHAVSGRAGVNVAKVEFHDYGVDGQLCPLVVRQGRTVENGFNLAFQAKCTTQWHFEEGDVVYDLEAKTYNDIVTRDPAAMPLALFLMCLPRDDRDWLSVDEGQAVLRKCCYWLRLPHGPITSNSRTVRVRVPRTNVLDVQGMLQLLGSVKAEALGELA
ncbi:DUF4365 domain-containing protein [Mesorhizobium sp.]|uniref:DUF4365 domain-containing protein n=1 Tax=Mesorhizobium sp. TaxID=1871066 RepID=UPI0025F1BF5B|nr:DUF4365 domain-containing protein [Mesorhizobium sp.]